MLSIYLGKENQPPAYPCTILALYRWGFASKYSGSKQPMAKSHAPFKLYKDRFKEYIYPVNITCKFSALLIEK